ncbi:hypothetical protein MKW98_011848, partial [Papaver atlanticum]
TFDVVDGKQARRSYSSSPLGELFDHGAEWWSQHSAAWDVDTSLSWIQFIS